MSAVEELVLVNPETNEYRVFRMVQQGRFFTCETTRSGYELAPPQTKPMKYWDEVLNRKLADGYVRRTDVVAVSSKGGYARIKDPCVREVVDYLLSVSKQMAQKDHSYTEISEVNPAMIKKAQGIIDEISAGDRKDLSWVNGKLLELFAVSLRKADDVRMLLAGPDSPVDSVLAREQAALDVLAGQVTIFSMAEPEKTVLDAFNVTMRPVTETEMAQIKRHMDHGTADRVKKAWRVKNAETDTRFGRYMEKHGLTEKNVRFLYHGSRAENWISLIVTGPVLHPDAAICGKALGDGIYLADRAEKSYHYCDGSMYARGCSGRAFMAVYKVAYGNPYITSQCGQYSKRNIAPHDIVHFKGGGVFVWDEYCVFDPAQITLQYLIELAA